jgi:hypothetical protein
MNITAEEINPPSETITIENIRDKKEYHKKKMRDIYK